MTKHDEVEQSKVMKMYLLRETNDVNASLKTHIVGIVKMDKAQFLIHSATEVVELRLFAMVRVRTRALSQLQKMIL